MWWSSNTRQAGICTSNQCHALAEGLLRRLEHFGEHGHVLSVRALFVHVSRHTGTHRSTPSPQARGELVGNSATLHDTYYYGLPLSDPLSYQ